MITIKCDEKEYVVQNTEKKVSFDANSPTLTYGFQLDGGGGRERACWAGREESEGAVFVRGLIAGRRGASEAAELGTASWLYVLERWLRL